MRWWEIVLYVLLVCAVGGLLLAAWWLAMIWLLAPVAELLAELLALLVTLAVVG